MTVIALRALLFYLILMLIVMSHAIFMHMIGRFGFTVIMNLSVFMGMICTA